LIVFALIASTMWHIAACEIANTESKDELKDVTRTALPLAVESCHFLHREFFWGGRALALLRWTAEGGCPHIILLLCFYFFLLSDFSSADCVRGDSVARRKNLRGRPG
jgi:hypothetical protein